MQSLNVTKQQEAINLMNNISKLTIRDFVNKLKQPMDKLDYLIKVKNRVFNARNEIPKSEYKLQLKINEIIDFIWELIYETFDITTALELTQCNNKEYVRLISCTDNVLIERMNTRLRNLRKKNRKKEKIIIDNQSSSSNSKDIDYNKVIQTPCQSIFSEGIKDMQSDDDEYEQELTKLNAKFDRKIKLKMLKVLGDNSLNKESKFAQIEAVVTKNKEQESLKELIISSLFE